MKDETKKALIWQAGVPLAVMIVGTGLLSVTGLVPIGVLISWLFEPVSIFRVLLLGIGGVTAWFLVKEIKLRRSLTQMKLDQKQLQPPMPSVSNPRRVVINAGPQFGQAQIKIMTFFAKQDPGFHCYPVQIRPHVGISEMYLDTALKELINSGLLVFRAGEGYSLTPEGQLYVTENDLAPFN